MAGLIIEIPGRHGSQYHRISEPVVRVGRALDNDIILSDPSVSPYHFVLRHGEAGRYQLHSLADENGIRIGRRQITEPVTLDRLPLEFDAGRTRVRILDSSQPVAPTRLISCLNGGACVFGHWGWALLLFAVLVLLSGIDNYLSTPKVISWESFGSDQLTIVLAALGLSLGLLLVNRMSSQRWDYPSSLSFVSLVLILAFLLDQFIPLADYFFTSAVPGYLISIAWAVLLLPFALGWFLIRLNHGSSGISMVLVIVLLTPTAYLQIKEFAAHYDLFDDFSSKAYYSDALYPWDNRLQNTIAIEEFSRLVSAQLVKKPAADQQ